MFEVFFSTGFGFSAGPRFRCKDDAIRYVGERRLDASFALRRPDGAWFCWPTLGAEILPRHSRSLAA